MTDEMKRQVHLSREMDVLDFGCGTELLTLALQPLVRNVTSVDTSTGMLQVLKGKLQRQGLTNVRTTLLEPQVPFSMDGRFHLIVSSMALHHVRSLAPLFGRFHDHLWPGGRVGLADLDREDGSFHEDPRDVFHHGFDRNEIQALLAAAGFVELGATTATVVHKETGNYPVFLVTGRSPD